jgi:hypothetical protein
MAEKMKIDKDKIYAVLTGDIVGSTKFKGNDRKYLHECLEASSQKLVDSFSGSVPYPPEFFRGDSWQFLVTDSSKSLRIGTFFRALIKASSSSKHLDTRLSIGLGLLDFIPEENISSGDGEAFRLSGEGLERLNKANRMGISFPVRLESNTAKAVEIILKLMDIKVTEWTNKQANAVCGALLDFTQETIARHWFAKKISQQAVAQHLDRAGWVKIASAIEFYETHLPMILHDEEQWENIHNK